MLSINPGQIVNERIIIRDGELSPEEMETKVRQLTRHGQITGRDEKLLEALRELNVLSLDHIDRLLWNSGVAQKTIYERMRKLARHHLVSSPRSPRNEMRAWGLEPSKVYALGALGRYWLGAAVNDARVPQYLKRDQILHDLLVAEFYVRAVEAALKRGEAWSLQWVGERGASFYPRSDQPPTIAPDGLGLLAQHQVDGPAMLPFFVEFDVSRQGHGRYSSDWGRKVVGYDRFAGSQWRAHPALGNLPEFPAVLVITHGAERILNLAAAIAEKRKSPVIYYLALWQDLPPDGDLFAAPVWLVIAPDGRLIGCEPEARQSLIVVEQA